MKKVCEFMHAVYKEFMTWILRIGYFDKHGNLVIGRAYTKRMLDFMEKSYDELPDDVKRTYGKIIERLNREFPRSEL